MDNGYKRHEWLPNEPITTLKLNNIEAGVEALHNMENDNTLERATNKITSGILNEENTNDQYPTVKVVWDSFQKVGEDNLIKYTGLNSQSEYLMNIQCYYDDKVTIKNLNDIYLVDENNNLTNKKVSLSELIDIYFQFSPWIDGLANQYTSSNFSIDFKYIEPNTGKIISNINNNIHCNLCARPPRKMEFVNLDENNNPQQPIYQNGDTLTINEIRDNLIFYAQDGYEWTYEQNGQTKKYVDFLNDSDFSFENGEQSIQLRMINDNALSESQELTINCNKTYGPSDFLQTINFSINVPIIINRTQISNIRLYTPPTKRVYLKGKDTKAVYTGLQLQLIDKNNNVWSSSNYPNGIIPFNELNITSLNISSLEQEEDTETYYGYDITWTSPSLVDENNIPRTMSINVADDNENYHLIVSTYHAKTMEIDTTNAKTEYNSGDSISVSGMNIVIKDSRGQPYIGLTNGKPNSIDILINPTVVTASDDIDYGKYELQYITASWIDSYNNSNAIESTYQIIVNKPYPAWWNAYPKSNIIKILKDIHDSKITLEELDITEGNPNLYKNNDTTFIQNTGSLSVYLLPNTNSYFKSNNEEIKAILLFQCTRCKMSKSTSSNNPWLNCDLQKWANSTFLNSLPSELQEMLKPISLISNNYTTGINNTNDKINLFSIFEIYNNITYNTDISNLKNQDAITTEHNLISTPFPEANKILNLLHEGESTYGLNELWTRTGIYANYKGTLKKSFILLNTANSIVTTDSPNSLYYNVYLFAAI